MKCEKCGKGIDHLKINVFDRDGSDYDILVPIYEDEESVLFETTPNWVGYELSEEEMMDDIRCTHCNQFPFKHKEVQVYNVVRVVCFKEAEE